MDAFTYCREEKGRTMKSARNWSILTGVAACGAYWALAGDLNPPTGTVAPTMHTLDEVYAAVGQVGAGNCAASCAPALPGSTGLRGTCTMVGAAGPGGDLTFDVYSSGQACVYDPLGGGGGGGAGLTTLNPVNIVRGTDANSWRLFRSLVSGVHLTSVTMTLKDPGGAARMVVTLSDVQLLSFYPTATQRCDGVSAQSESIDLKAVRYRYTDPVSGHYWEFNTQTGTGTGA